MACSKLTSQSTDSPLAMKSGQVAMDRADAGVTSVENCRQRGISRETADFLAPSVVLGEATEGLTCIVRCTVEPLGIALSRACRACCRTQTHRSRSRHPRRRGRSATRPLRASRRPACTVGREHQVVIFRCGQHPIRMPVDPANVVGSAALHAMEPALDALVRPFEAGFCCLGRGRSHSGR